ncbi:CGNR zinc finger domain-containing protein [Streptomyces netropsis]|uniref:CGNR zinc finger domain-containing protein n=1 Tax=Streptomyces netropsis TaxID=55404 RepID=UPI0030CA98D5
MLNTGVSGQQMAPDGLEPVRILLNTWLIPPGTRQLEDRFNDFLHLREVSGEHGPLLREFRDDLRAGMGARGWPDERINTWIDRCGIRVTVEGGQVAFRHTGTPVGEMMTAVLHAIQLGHWRRLKACPGCHWVFYDHSKSGSKRWCQVAKTDGPTGRACGTLDKSRRHRARQMLTVPAVPVRPPDVRPDFTALEPDTTWPQ